MKIDWDTERNNFEVAMLRVACVPADALKKDEQGNYLHGGINSAWVGWQKGAKGEKKI